MLLDSAQHRGREGSEAVERKAVEDEGRAVLQDDKARRSSAGRWRTRPYASDTG